MRARAPIWAQESLGSRRRFSSTGAKRRGPEQVFPGLEMFMTLIIARSRSGARRTNQLLFWGDTVATVRRTTCTNVCLFPGHRFFCCFLLVCMSLVAMAPECGGLRRSNHGRPVCRRSSHANNVGVLQCTIQLWPVECVRLQMDVVLDRSECVVPWNKCVYVGQNLGDLLVTNNEEKFYCRN